MNLKKQKKSICVLLIISMLFLGMCFESVQAGSSFSCESTTFTTSTIRSTERTTLTSQIYAEETLAWQDCITSFQQAVRLTFSRTTRGIALYLALVDILPQVSPIYYTSSNCELSKESSSNTIIINFIHHKDGKKA